MSSFSKIPGYVWMVKCDSKTLKVGADVFNYGGKALRFRKYPGTSGRDLMKTSVFGARKGRLRVDGSRIRRKTSLFSKIRVDGVIIFIFKFLNRNMFYRCVY